MINCPAVSGHCTSRLKRMLAIDPTHRGFGFAVLEGPDRLVDWGVVHVRNDKHRCCLKRIGQLIDKYNTDTVATEDVTAPGSRRGTRVRRLVEAIQMLAEEKQVAFQRISRGHVWRSFSESGLLTKQRIATVIADRFPELLPQLPRPRKCYESADDRLAIFDATSFALALRQNTL